MYSAAKSQYSGLHIQLALVTQTIEKQSHPHIKDFASDCKRHSLVLVSVVVNIFASFLVRSVMFTHGYVYSILDNWFLFDCGFL